MLDFNLNSLITSCVTIGIGFFTYYTIKIYLLRQKFSHIPGPATRGILGFYFGNSIDMYKATRQEKKVMMEVVSNWIEKHGTTIKFQILDKMIIFTVDLKATREILIEKDFPKQPRVYNNLAFPYGIRFIGQGLVTDMDKKRWKHRRGLFNPAFHKQVLSSFIDEYNTKGDMLLEKIRLMADGKTEITMLDEFNHAALDVIATIAFGMETDTLSNPNNDLNRSITEALKLIFKFSTSKNIGFSMSGVSDRNEKKTFKEIANKLRKIGRDQIQYRLKCLKEGSYVPNDLLTITLKSYENEPFDMEDMIDDFITFFIAGQETTANTMSFCISELAQHPEIVEKMREEIDRVFGSTNIINIDQVSELHYTTCVIKETLRMWPVVPGINRVTSEDYEINSLFIPKGTWIQANTFACGRHSDYFPEPTKFKPERFLNENSTTDGVKTYSYFPFSLGPRNCIGQNFAMLEMKILISKLIKNFEFRLVPDQILYPIQLTTLRPTDGTKCFVLPRKMD